MVPAPLVMLGAIVLLLPIAYLLLAAPAFLMVSLDIQAVSRLLRGVFNAYLIALAVAGLLSALSFAIERRPDLVAGAGLIAAAAALGRRWLLPRMDRLRAAGDPGAGRGLRRLHWNVMICNAALLAGVMAGFPYLATPG